MTRLWHVGAIGLVAIGCVAASPSVAQPAGPLVGWGDNSFGQLNFPAGGSYKAVSGDFSNTAAIREDGTIEMWGDFWGGLGTPPPTGRFIALDGGRDGFVAIRENGTLAAWGVNAHGLLNVPSGTFKYAEAGSNAYAAVRTDGSLVAWGALSTATPPAGNNFVAVTPGEGSALALRADGTVVGWGGNFYNELVVPQGTYKDIALTRGWAVGVRTDGSVVFWGNQAPQTMGGLAIGPFVEIEFGSEGGSPVGLRADGTLAMTVQLPGVPPDGVYVGVGAGAHHWLAIVPAPSVVSVLALGIGLVARRRMRTV